MLSARETWTSVGLLVLGATHAHCGGIQGRQDHPSRTSSCAPYDPSPLAPPSVTRYPYHTPYVCSTTSTIYTTETCVTTATAWSTAFTTVTATTTITCMTTATVTATVTSTYVTTITDPIKETTTETTTATTTDLMTTTVTVTVASDPCPTFCTETVGTVELFYWPTSDPALSYPSTYVDSALDYTFTSPSVYFFINTIFGTNGASQTGPAATNTIWAFDLDEVSTIVPDSGATQQLTLNDLGTNCPLSIPQSVLATTVRGGSCDPILAAPSAIRSWASPCGACGGFGLFDPPYAIPTITGGLLPTTARTTSSPAASPTNVVNPQPTTTSTTTKSTTTSSSSTTSSAAIVTSSTSTPTPSAVQTAAAPRAMTSGIWGLIMVFASILLFV